MFHVPQIFAKLVKNFRRQSTNRRRWRLLLGEHLGKIQPPNRHKFLTRPRKMERKPARNFWRKSRKIMAVATTPGRRPGDAHEGCGDYSWEKTWRCSEALLRPSPGDSADMLAPEKYTQPQTMKLCIFSGFFNTFRPTAPPTAFHSGQWQPMTNILLGEDLGMLTKGAATIPGRRPGDAPKPCSDLRREIV
jgi:hypothetical protein